MMLKQVVCVVLFAVLGYWIFPRIVRLGAFHQAYHHAPGECFHLSGIEHGSEDIQVLPNGLAFISSGINLLKRSAGDVTSSIFLFDFNHPKAAPVKLKIVGEEKYWNINPHGISLWTDPKTGDVYLYVINHVGKEVVDKYRFDSIKKTLQHIKRFEDEPNFHSTINDLVVVGEDQFYYTNCLYWNMMMELALNLHWGEVGFYDRTNATIVERGLLLPNGITASKDGKLVYVAHWGEDDLRVYRRNKDNTLAFDQSIVLGTILDNLDIDAETGDLWAGAHPSMFKVLKHIEDITGYASPSQVFRIRFPGTTSSSSVPEIVEVYENDGTQLAASSVAVRYKKGMLIGTIFTRALYCQLDCY